MSLSGLQGVMVTLNRDTRTLIVNDCYIGRRMNDRGQIDISEQGPESASERRRGRADGARGETCFDTRQIPSEFLGRRKRPNKHLYSEISAPFVSSFVINLSGPDLICRNR